MSTKLSLQITPLSPSLVTNYSSSSSSSPQIFFEIFYEARHKLGDQKVSPSRRNRALPVVFSSTVESWNSDPNTAVRNLFHKFNLLGIDSRQHETLLGILMDRIYDMVNSRFQANVMSLEIKVIYTKTYPSLEFLKDEQSGKVCRICLEEIGANGVSTECGHVFHCDCITEWLDRGESCPLCRRSMMPPDHIRIYGSAMPMNPAFA